MTPFSLSIFESYIDVESIDKQLDTLVALITSFS